MHLRFVDCTVPEQWAVSFDNSYHCRLLEALLKYLLTHPWNVSRKARGAPTEKEPQETRIKYFPSSIERTAGAKEKTEMIAACCYFSPWLLASSK